VSTQSVPKNEYGSRCRAYHLPMAFPGVAAVEVSLFSICGTGPSVCSPQKSSLFPHLLDAAGAVPWAGIGLSLSPALSSPGRRGNSSDWRCVQTVLAKYLPTFTQSIRARLPSTLFRPQRPILDASSSWQGHHYWVSRIWKCQRRKESSARNPTYLHKMASSIDNGESSTTGNPD
jgi:hypothetical protein